MSCHCWILLFGSSNISGNNFIYLRYNRKIGMSVFEGKFFLKNIIAFPSSGLLLFSPKIHGKLTNFLTYLILLFCSVEFGVVEREFCTHCSLTLAS
jgi:hypothetical protein